VSYTMIGASLAPAMAAAFFWKRVTRAGGVASIAAGMLTVIIIVILNNVVKNDPGGSQFLGQFFPVDTDYIALPSVIVSITTLVVVSLFTRRPEPEDWADFIDS